jgi:hypothetical protein
MFAEVYDGERIVSGFSQSGTLSADLSNHPPILASRQEA